MPMLEGFSNTYNGTVIVKADGTGWDGKTDVSDYRKDIGQI